MSAEMQRQADEFVQQLAAAVVADDFDGTQFTCYQTAGLKHLLSFWAFGSEPRDRLLMVADLLQASHSVGHTDVDNGYSIPDGTDGAADE